MITRQQYMDQAHEEFLKTKSGANAHRRYYGQFVTDGVKRLIPWSVESLTRQTDPENTRPADPEYFNHIPLGNWDSIAGHLPYDVVKMIAEANGGGVSLSDRVCVLKEAARQIVEGVENGTSN